MQLKNIAVQGVRKLVEALDFINPKGRLKDHCCKECTGSEIQITKGYLKVCRKECKKRSSWKLEFISKSSRGITPLNTSKEDRDRTTSKGDRGRNHLIEVKFRRENTESFG